MSSLLKSRKFWLAVFGLIQTIVFQFVPTFPDSVWQAINILVIVLITAIAVEDGAEKSGDTYIMSGSTTGVDDTAYRSSELPKKK